MVGAETGAGRPFMSRCEREASLPHRAQMALSFTTSSASASSLGIGPKGSPRKSMSRPVATTSYPASARSRLASTMPSSKNCASSMATTSVVSSTFSTSSPLVATAVASCGTPLWERISVRSERVSMACLKTCTLRRAYRVRRTRRINSSVLPENIEPVMTMSAPVLCVVASRGDSRIRVMIRILLTVDASTWPTSSARVAVRSAPFPPVPDGGDHDYREQEDPCCHEEQADVFGRLPAEVGVEEGLGNDAQSRGHEEVAEPHVGQARGVGDGVEGDARKEAPGENGVHAPAREPAVGGLQPRSAHEHLHGDPAEGARDTEAYRGREHVPEHGEYPAPENPEGEPVGEGDEERRYRRNERLQDHKKTRGHGSPQPERYDVVPQARDIPASQYANRLVRLGTEAIRQEIQQAEHRHRRREQHQS